MYSEIENLLKGRVETTTEYDNSKKIIGVNDANITPDDKGICPLGKQGAFTVEETKAPAGEVNALDSLNGASSEAVEETLSFGAPAPTPAAPTPEPAAPADAAPKFVLPAALESDVTDTLPVEVAPTDNLETLMPEAPAPVEILAEEKETEAQVDIQMPVLEEKPVANEPTAANDNLFVTPGEPTSILPDATPDAAPTEIVMESAGTTAAPANTGDLEAIVNQKFDDLKKKIVAFVEEEIERAKAETLAKLNPTQAAETTAMTTEEKPALENPITMDTSTVESNVMAEAMDQINNMVIPDLGGPTL